MTTRTTPTTERDKVTDTNAKLDEALAAVTEADPWATLPEPVPMPSKYTPANGKVDVIADVPQVIRQRAETSLATNAARLLKTADSTAQRPRVDYHWDVQKVTDTKQGQDFADHLTRYGKYRPVRDDIPFADAGSPQGQVTARCMPAQYYCTDADGDVVSSDAGDDGAFLGIRYSVRPFEQRNAGRRLPGTTV